MLTMTGRLPFLVSLPERALRSVFALALAGGGVRETVERASLTERGIEKLRGAS
jgi:hypothetical protein